MMLAHEIFDPEHNKRVLVDHAFIVAGGDRVLLLAGHRGTSDGRTPASQPNASTGLSAIGTRMPSFHSTAVRELGCSRASRRMA
jgi:hypothetical protein